jgi:osmotically-inducible protein OsmY
MAGDPRFKDTTIWVRTLRAFVFLQGCVRSEAQRKQILGAVGALPRVERVVDELMIGTSAKPPYKLPPK